MALKALGNAGEAAGPVFAAADPVVRKARNLARTGASPTTKLAKFLITTKKTGGWDGLVDLIYNGTGSLSEFDQYGHYLRSLVTLSNCLEYVAAETSGCGAKFSSRESSASAFDSAAMYRKIQEQLAELSGGTGATTTGPSTYLTPSSPAEPTPELGEGEELGLGEGTSPPGEAEAEAQPEAEAEVAPAPRQIASPSQRALLEYLLGP